jgi:spermidine/putrescine transport system substrate-binding protein
MSETPLEATMTRRASIDSSRRRLLAGMGALGLSLGLPRARAQERVKLSFLSRRGLLPEEALAGFSAAANTDVTIDLYTDAAGVYDKIRMGRATRDLLVAPDRVIQRLIFGSLLQRLDRSLIPNLGNLDATFTNADFDPGRRYSVAYLWGTIGIGYRRSAVDGEPDTWKWLFDSDRYAGRIALPDDPQVTVRLALKYLGHSVNTLDASQIEAAGELLRKQRPRISRFTSQEVAGSLAAREVDLVIARNGDIVRAREQDPDIAFVVPREGTLLVQDCLCIPHDAPHPREAHALIDYLLRSEVGASIAHSLRYPTPNAAARAALPEQERNDPVIYPPQDVLQRSEIAAYLGERPLQLYERVWQRVHPIA